MACFKYIRAFYGYSCPCIYMVCLTDKKRFVYEISVIPTDSDGNVLDQKPLLVKTVRGWLRAKIEFKRIYNTYYKKVNGGNKSLW